jgi:ribosomal protein S18 acetylase RimI-like enzyme
MSSPSPTREFVDKEGEQVRITPYLPTHHDSLVDMYFDYPREHRSQGLPPAQEQELEGWLTRLIDNGRNFVATIDERVVGHAAYSPVGASAADYVIFIDPDYHNHGIGTVLIRHTIKHAASEGFDRIVSHVSHDNEGAIHLYEKIGFERVSSSRMNIAMGIDLREHTPDDFDIEDSDLPY